MRHGLIAVAMLGLLARAGPAWAQTAESGRLVRGDVTAALGWLEVKKDSGEGNNDWSPTLFGGVDVGVYWTDHIKTELQAGANREYRVYVPERIEVNGRSLYAASNYRFSARRFSVLGKYQFGHNQWFHPFLGGGVEIAVERISERESALYFYDTVTRASQLVRPDIQHPDRTETRALAVAHSGFKAYLHPRAFFLSDLRCSFRNEIEEVLLRFGFGIDF